MTVTVATFRANFPEFASDTTYPDTEVEFWLGLALLLHDAGRWGNLLDYGVQLFIAHNLSLQAQSAAASGGGQAPGQIQGPLTSASVDKVSYSRDPGAAMDPANGHWNLSTYGLRYIRLVRMIGAGPLQVGVPLYDSSQPSGLGWPGVIFPPSTP